jgi:hypothetical protein
MTWMRLKRVQQCVGLGRPIPHSVAVALSLAMVGADLYPESHVGVHLPRYHRCRRRYLVMSHASFSSLAHTHLRLYIMHADTAQTGQCLTTFKHIKLRIHTTQR